MCASGWTWGDIPQAPSSSLRLLEGLSQASEDIRVVPGCGEVAEVNSLGKERSSQHGFPCGLWHPTPHRLEAAILPRTLAGPVDQALEGRLCPGAFLQLPELHVGPAAPPLSMGRAMALGGGVGVGVCGGVMGTGARGGPGGVLIVLCRGRAWGAGARAYVDLWIRKHGLLFGVGLGSVVAAVAGHLLDVHRHRGLVGQRGRCWWAPALLSSGRGWSVGLGCGL